MLWSFQNTDKGHDKIVAFTCTLSERSFEAYAPSPHSRSVGTCKRSAHFGVWNWTVGMDRALDATQRSHADQLIIVQLILLVSVVL